MSSRLAVPVGPSDHVMGRDSAPVTLVEYGDFECPHCGVAFGEVEQVRRVLGRELRFVYRHFPLLQIHPRAEIAAEAAEAAGAQGQFWEMYEQLFLHQRELDDESLLVYADGLGLDVDRFAEELEAGTLAPRVEADLVSGVRSEVEGTPTFFVNGVRHDGPHDVPSLGRAIERARDALGRQQP